VEATLEARVVDRTESSSAVPKVLVVDDDPMVLNAVTGSCAQMGFDVVTAISGLQALNGAAEHRPDVLVIDVHLPEVDGLSVLAYLSEAAKSVPHVIVMTGRAGEQVVERCRGFDAFCIAKGPLFWEQLESLLAGIYPEMAFATRRSARLSAKTDVTKRPRVLLVDDDVSVKRMFFHRFDRLGADLLYATDATRGFWKARREQPTVIVADFCMPRGDAKYLLTKLRSTPETGTIPVIVQTGRCLSDPVRQKLREDIDGRPGAATILRKSFDGRELLDALRRYCGFAPDCGSELALR
jgi:CheY-like chemotaxis protein